MSMYVMIYTVTTGGVIALKSTEYAQAYNEHYKYVFRVANQILHNTFDAEDVAASVFLRLYELNLNDYEINDLHVLLYSITKNTALRYKQKYYNRETGEIDINKVADEFENKTINSIMAKEMMRALNEYNHTWCTILYYNKALGYSCTEIGKKYGMSPVAVRVSLYRAKKYIKECNIISMNEILGVYVFLFFITEYLIVIEGFIWN